MNTPDNTPSPSPAPHFESHSDLPFQRVEQSVVDETSERIGIAYDLEPELVDRGKSTAIFLVSDEDYLREKANDLYAQFDGNTDALRHYTQSRVPIFLGEEEILATLHKHIDRIDSLNQEQKRQMTFQMAQRQLRRGSVGFFSRRQDGSRVIFVSSTIPEIELQDYLEHELIHSIAHGGFGEQGGFKDFIPAFKAGGELTMDILDEGGAEILRLGINGSTLEDIRESGSVLDSMYPNETDYLLYTLASTLHFPKPITIKDFAKDYFGDSTNEKGRGMKFIHKLYLALPVELHYLVKELYAG